LKPLLGKIYSLSISARLSFYVVLNKIVPEALKRPLKQSISFFDEFKT
jgi:hypothetical protein